MKVIYPAIFHPEEKGYYVSFPDLPGCLTVGDDLQEAYEMAEEVLGVYLSSRLDNELEFSEPSPFGSVKSREGVVCYISADPDKYRKKRKSVRKNLTIPKWLNIEAEKAGINFSEVLQEAIRLKLGI